MIPSSSIAAGTIPANTGFASVPGGTFALLLAISLGGDGNDGTRS